MKKLAFILAVMAVMFTACQESPLDVLPQEPQGGVPMSLNLSVQGMEAGTAETKQQSNSYAITKSDLENEPSTVIQNLWVLQFSSAGKIACKPQYIGNYQQQLTDNGNVSVNLIPSGTEEHTIVYVANTFKEDLTAQLGSSFSIDEFKALTYPITNEQSNFNVFKDEKNIDTYCCVLYGEKTQAISDDGLEECKLSRNVAKINVKISVASGVVLTFSEAVVRGVPAIASYFPNIEENVNFPADDSFKYTNYESEKITDLTRTITFYVPVNMRGTSASDTGAMKNHYGTPYCTSISLVAKSGANNFIYTFFLGADLINDYNLAPNTEYTYNLTFNTVGDPDTDLRIEKAGGIDFSPSIMPRSNCYILNPSAAVDSEFIIPIDRIDDFWGDSRYNTGNIQGNTLSDVGDNWEAVILWHDHTGNQIYDATTDQIGGFKLEEDKSNHTVKVTLPKEFATSDNHCNVVFVVRKTKECYHGDEQTSYNASDSKNILWSWHLWITDYNPYPKNLIPSLNVFQYKVPGGDLHRYDNEIFRNGIYSQRLIMDRNIGARSATNDGYGLSGTIFTSPGTLHYQYGRFSPYPAKVYYYCNSYDLTTYPTDSGTTGQASFADAVQIPYAHIKNDKNWCNENDAESTEYIWNDYTINSLTYKKGKSIFDPSPMGFCVPIIGIWEGFTSGIAQSEIDDPNSFTFKLINIKDGESVTPNNRIYKGFAFYPAVGYCYNTSGYRGFVGSYGYCWSAMPSSSTFGYNLRLSDEFVSRANSNSRAYGFPVRPIQE